jgi:hypothetical protein
MTCQAPQLVLKDFGEAVAKGSVPATATVIYQATGHEGDNAKLRPYWRRITQQAQEASVWTQGCAELPIHGNKPAVLLTGIQFDKDTVEKFVKERRQPRPKRGKTRDQNHWASFWIAAAQLAKAGVLNVGHFPTQKDLSERLYTMIDGALEEGTIKPFVAAIYQQVAEPSLTELEEMVMKSA